MKNINPLLLSLMMLVISSCGKIDLQTADSNVAVVESYIRPASEIQIMISKQIVFLSEESDIEYLKDLDVRLKHNETWIDLIFKYDSIYVAEGINVNIGDVYEMEFEYNEKTISSSTLVPSEPQNFHLSSSTIEISSAGPGPGSVSMEPIEITWYNPEGDYHMIVVENIEENPILIDDDEDRPVRTFRNAPLQGDTQELSPRSFVYFGRHRVILFKLNPEYAALYEDLETTSLDLSAPPTNIQNGLGIFTGYNSDTLYLNVVAAK